MHIEYPPSLSVSDIVQMEFKKLSKRYWGKYFLAIGYDVWSTGNVTQDMVDEYLEHHWNSSNKDLGTMILE